MLPTWKQDIVVAVTVAGVVVLGLVTLLLATTSTVQEERVEVQNATMARHVNPLELKPVTPPPRLLENMIASVLEALAKGNTREAVRLIEILNETMLPKKWRLVVEGVVADLAKLAKLVENATTLEKRIRARADLNDIAGVLEACREAGRLLANLNITYNMLVDKMNRLARLGVNVASLREKIEETVSPTQQLEQQVHKTLLETRLAQYKLHPTRLWLNATPSKAFYGEKVAVRGCLASDEGPLPGKPIILYHDNRTRTLYTSVDGCFETTIKATTEKDYIIVYAEYVPQGRERLLYTYARSPTINIEVLRVKPILLVHVHNYTVHPGENVTVSIFSNVEEVEVVVEAFNTTQTTRLKGFLTRYTLHVPPETPAGVYNITVTVPRQGRVAEANATDRVVVVREQLNAIVHITPIALAGLDIPVTLYTNTTVKVLVSTPWTTYTATATPNKTHTVRVYIPATYSDVFAHVRVVLDPLDPHYERYSVEYSVVVVNPLALATLLATPIIALAPILHQRQAKLAKTPAKLLKTLTRRERGRREILTYGSILERVEKTVGARLLPSETLREYLGRVRETLDENAYRVLERIVYVYEAILYGGHRELMRELISRVEELERVRRWSQQDS